MKKIFTLGATIIVTFLALNSNVATAQTTLVILETDTKEKGVFGRLESADQKEGRLLMVYATKRIDWKGQIKKLEPGLIVFEPLVNGKKLPLIEFTRGEVSWQCKGCDQVAGKKNEFQVWRNPGKNN